MGNSVLLGKASVLDDPLRLEIKASKIAGTQDDVDQATGIVIEQLIQLPRLIRDLRQICSKPDDDALVLNTLQATSNIYHSASNSCIESIIHASTTFRPSDTLLDNQFSDIEYSSQRVFGLAVFHHQSRTMVCGIIDRLFCLRPVLTGCFFDRTTIQEQDMFAAEYLAASKRYAFNPSIPGVRQRALRISTPITVSYAAWHRLKRRSGGVDSLAFEKARVMQERCVKILRRMYALWKIGEVWATNPATLEQISDLLVGGPTLPQFSPIVGPCE